MSNDVQSHEEVAERAAGEERRGALRHAARSLGSVTARIIGGSQVELVNFSNRGVLFECDSRLLIGARASVRITTTDTNLIVSGRVVRSRVKGLVNGALRYDAALLLDAELDLGPGFVDAPAGNSSDDDELVAFESELEATFDPSPVEAYLAESEASLLEVAHGSDLPHHERAAEPAFVADPEPAFEPPPLPPLASPALASQAIEASALEVPAAPEPIAFEDDAEIAFEPAVEFAFDEAGEPSFDDPALDPVAVVAMDAVDPAAAAEPVGTSIFDATYMPPAVDAVVVVESQFDVRAPRPAFGTTPSSFFDARPSESYGAPPADGAVAFEAEDGVMFEDAFGGASVVDAAVVVDPILAGPDPILAAEPPVALEAAGAPNGVDLSMPDTLIDPPAAVPDTEDRVLLQFAATVPHDLAELRRIAADNQW